MISASALLDKLNIAKSKHGSGYYADAERLYREILAADKDNPEVTGLLAAALLQQGDLKHAKKLWKRALAIESPSYIFLRNLHNFLSALLKEGAIHDATIQIGQYPIPTWPSARIPDPAEKRFLLNLADILVILGQREASYRLLESVLSSLPNDSELLHAFGKAQLLKGDKAGAWKTLTKADTAIQPRFDYSLLTDLYQCAESLGDDAAVRTLRSRVVEACPSYTPPSSPNKKGHILVLAGPPKLSHEITTNRQLHFNKNYPSQLSRILADDFLFSSALVSEQGGRAAAKQLPPPDIIINNYTNGELLLSEGDLEAVSEFADSFGVPVINHPRHAVLTTRDRSIEMVADIPGILAPKTRRFTKDAKPIDHLVEEIESEFEYPMITRSLTSQEGQGMTKVDDREALIGAIKVIPKEAFFVTSFVDSRGSAEYYRKIRAAIVDDQILIVRVDYDTYWNVHGRKSDARVAFYKSHPRLLAEEDRICTDPDRTLGKTVMQSLQTIRDRIPLEVFGVDFDVTEAGQLVFYEANATMNLFSSARPEVAHPKHVEEHLKTVFRNYLSGLISGRYDY